MLSTAALSCVRSLEQNAMVKYLVVALAGISALGLVKQHVIGETPVIPHTKIVSSLPETDPRCQMAAASEQWRTVNAVQPRLGACTAVIVRFPDGTTQRFAR